MDDDVRCWWCGARPLDVRWLGAWGEQAHVPLAQWASVAGDHAHEVNAPTPAQLIDRGYRSMRRITEIWSD